MENIKELKEQRDNLILKMEESVNLLESTKSTETKEEILSLEKEIEAIDMKIASIEQEMEQMDTKKSTEKLENIIRNKEMDNKTVNEVLREAIYGTDANNTANAKILLPASVEASIVQKRHEGSVLRKYASVMKASGNSILAVEAGLATAAFGTEIATVTENTPTFGTVDFKAVRCGSLVKISEDALKDSAFDLESEIVSQISRAYATIENTKFVNGSGTNEPQGFLSNATVGKTVTSLTLTWDDIESLYFALKAPYRANAVWMMNSKTLKAVKALITDDGAQNAPLKEILGRPVEIVEDMPDIVDTKKPIAFGDFAYYKIMDRQGVEMKVLEELYAVNGMVGYLANARLDGHLTLAEAVQVLAVAIPVTPPTGE